MQRFRPDMGVAAQHFPILVARYERDLFYGETRLKHAACALVTQIVEMQVLHRDFYASTPEGGANRSRVIGEYLALKLPQMLALRYDKRLGIESRGIKQRDALVSSGLVARVIAIPDGEHPTFDIQIAPFNAVDFIEVHGGRDGELHDPCHR